MTAARPRVDDVVSAAGAQPGDRRLLVPEGGGGPGDGGRQQQLRLTGERLGAVGRRLAVLRCAHQQVRQHVLVPRIAVREWAGEHGEQPVHPGAVDRPRDAAARRRADEARWWRSARALDSSPRSSAAIALSNGDTACSLRSSNSICSCITSSSPTKIDEAPVLDAEREHDGGGDRERRGWRRP